MRSYMEGQDLFSNCSLSPKSQEASDAIIFSFFLFQQHLRRGSKVEFYFEVVSLLLECSSNAFRFSLVLDCVFYIML